MKQNPTLDFQRCTTLIQRQCPTLKQRRNNVTQRRNNVAQRWYNVDTTLFQPSVDVLNPIGLVMMVDCVIVIHVKCMT